METISIAAIFLGPIFAVAITLWWQRRKERQDAKLHLFLTLMAQRRSLPPTIDLVKALNLIDVVFADTPLVLEWWHKYFEHLSNPPSNQNFQPREHTYLTMLSAMARSLGYKKLEQTDIDKFYSPQAHVDQIQMNSQIQSELLRVLQNTAHFVVASEPTSKRK
jgi:hypothetical protein